MEKLSKQRRWQLRQTAAGRCPHCGAKRQRLELSLCAECMQDSTDRAKARYAESHPGAAQTRCTACEGVGHNRRTCSVRAAS